MPPVPVLLARLNRWLTMQARVHILSELLRSGVDRRGPVYALAQFRAGLVPAALAGGHPGPLVGVEENPGPYRVSVVTFWSLVDAIPSGAYETRRSSHASWSAIRRACRVVRNQLRGRPVSRREIGLRLIAAGVEPNPGPQGKAAGHQRAPGRGGRTATAAVGPKHGAARRARDAAASDKLDIRRAIERQQEGAFAEELVRSGMSSGLARRVAADAAAMGVLPTSVAGGPQGPGRPATPERPALAGGQPCGGLRSSCPGGASEKVGIPARPQTGPPVVAQEAGGKQGSSPVGSKDGGAGVPGNAATPSVPHLVERVAVPDFLAGTPPPAGGERVVRVLAPGAAGGSMDRPGTPANSPCGTPSPFCPIPVSMVGGLAVEARSTADPSVGCRSLGVPSFRVCAMRRRWLGFWGLVLAGWAGFRAFWERRAQPPPAWGPPRPADPLPAPGPEGPPRRPPAMLDGRTPNPEILGRALARLGLKDACFTVRMVAIEDTDVDHRLVTDRGVHKTRGDMAAADVEGTSYWQGWEKILLWVAAVATAASGTCVPWLAALYGVWSVVAIALCGCLLGLTLWIRSWSFRGFRFLLPLHMVDAARAEFSAFATAETVEASAHQKLLRLATLPVPDAVAVSARQLAEAVLIEEARVGFRPAPPSSRGRWGVRPL